MPSRGVPPLQSVSAERLFDQIMHLFDQITHVFHVFVRKQCIHGVCGKEEGSAGVMSSL